MTDARFIKIADCLPSRDRAFSALALAVGGGLQRDVGAEACPHYNVLNDLEWGQLASRPYAAHESKAAYGCELQADHPGPHMALAQSFDGYEAWLRWAVRSRELVDLTPCEASDGPVDDPELCLLFNGHPGPHTFEASTPV
ncbi:hypothetical protein [Nonomuraea dietziae]|uniref:hypothetical protein n=1 Tax=Nonomuraea dietziae TaxID=65515 RepID=UPI0033F06E89